MSILINNLCEDSSANITSIIKGNAENEASSLRATSNEKTYGRVGTLVLQSTVEGSPKIAITVRAEGATDIKPKSTLNITNFNVIKGDNGDKIALNYYSTYEDYEAELHNNPLFKYQVNIKGYAKDPNNPDLLSLTEIIYITPIKNGQIGSYSRDLDCTNFTPTSFSMPTIECPYEITLKYPKFATALLYSLKLQEFFEDGLIFSSKIKIYMHEDVSFESGTLFIKITLSYNGKNITKETRNNEDLVYSGSDGKEYDIGGTSQNPMFDGMVFEWEGETINIENVQFTDISFYSTNGDDSITYYISWHIPRYYQKNKTCYII